MDLDKGKLARWRGFPKADYFTAYLERPSKVAVHSLDEICNWLCDCQYYDKSGYTDTTAWPIPCDFETTRAGNCFDHALWGWRKLTELDIPSLLILGQTRDQADLPWDRRPHAWVQFEFEDAEYLFETTAKGNGWPGASHIAEVRDWYRPWYAVDSKLRRYVHYGYFHYLLYDPVQ
jgi:hypothetical protein